MVACASSADKPQGPELREITLRSLPEDFVEAGFSGGSRPRMKELLDALAETAEEPMAKGVFLRLGPFGGGWARAAEVRKALDAIREADKPVHCHLEMADNLSFATAARACDRLTMTPSGLLELVGVAAQVVYARQLLEQAGMRADAIQIGRYKGAADSLTRDDMPPETAETLNHVLDVLHAELLDALVAGRKLDQSRAQAAIDGGPYDAADARKLGLVDDIEFDDEARAHAKAAAKAAHINKLKLHETDGPPDWTTLFKVLAGGGAEPEPKEQRLAVVYLTGVIGSRPSAGMGGVTAGRFVKKLRELADDNDVKALVLRIDSPGGSATASDRIWHAVRRVAKRKPVVASVGDMAASGGYWIASGAHQILAQETSLVGSIGVVGGKLVLGPLAQRLGLKVQVLRRGAQADWSSSLRAFSDQERATLTRLLEATYRRFVRRIAEGRGLERDAILPAAEGRLMTGRKARSHKLIDDYGGLPEALALARDKAGVDSELPIEEWPRDAGVFGALGRLLHGEQGDAWAAVHQHLPELRRAAVLRTLAIDGERQAAALPYLLSLR